MKNISIETTEGTLETDEYATTEIYVKGVYVGEVELYLSNDKKKHGTDLDEWILTYRKAPQNDPDIIAQGNL